MHDFKAINLIAILLFSSTASLLTACHSTTAIPLHDSTATSTSDKPLIVIVYYDSSIGTDAIEAFIKNNKIEVVYRYTNLHGYALKLPHSSLRTSLQKVKGVLSVNDDQIMHLQ